MITALQTYLSWDLRSPVTYQAGQELRLTLNFTAPEAGLYYLLGALFTPSLDYIPGSLFGIYVPEGADYAIASAEYASLWELQAGQSASVPCRLSFDRTDVVLGIFLFRMVGDAPSLEVDPQIGYLSAELVAPKGLDLGSVMGMVVAVTMLGFVTREMME